MNASNTVTATPTDSVELELRRIRAMIDRLDQQMKAILAERNRWVRAAARCKRNLAGQPEHVDQAMARAIVMAGRCCADALVVERSVQDRIAAYLKSELAALRALDRH